MTDAATLAEVVREALAKAELPDRDPAFERPRQRAHGDWSTNVALTLAKPVGRPPREIAQRVVEHLDLPVGVERVEVAGAGFVNFHLSHAALEEVVRAAAGDPERWGRWELEAGRVNIEFVSSNPTGPLHVGHGRQAALGDAIASLLEATGWDVTREYYFNDASNQMHLFGDSVIAASKGEPPPEGGYKGAYVRELAEELAASGELDNAREAAYGRMHAHITATLDRLGVHFDVFFGERRLHDGGIELAVERMRSAGHVYDQDGAVWLRTTAFGDDKDRVLIRANGAPTYFAADCAYMADKFRRGFDRCIYVLGSDHHGYVRRLKAIAAAEGIDPDRVEIVIHQFVNLLRGGEVVKLSTRSGDLITFDELIDEVGPDAARYTFLRFSSDVTIDFDLAEVVRQDRENPVYYVQYSHARIAGIMRTARERGVEPGALAEARLDLLTHETEEELIRRIGAFPETVRFAAGQRAPHRVARYAEELAEAFHRFYTECTVLSDDPHLTRARFWLCVATRQTLAGALGLLGVGAPERM